jgi:hypothetical protein
MYGKAGAGKTRMMLALTRAALGTPGHCDFLGFRVDPSVYGQRRALLLTSDAGVNAIPFIQEYSTDLISFDDEWLQHYVNVIGMNRKLGADPWKLQLRDMHKLVQWLDAAADAGQPYSMIVIDSLKAVLPDDYLVGDQVMSIYLRILDAICHTRNVCLVIIHHAHKDGSGPQGVAALTEMTSGNFRLSVNDQGQSIFHIEKTRIRTESREIAWTIADDGSISSDQPIDSSHLLHDSLLQFFHDDYQSHILGGGFPINYPGISFNRLHGKAKASGIADLANASERSIIAQAKQLLSSGLLITKGSGRMAALMINRETSSGADFNPFIDMDDED